MLKMGWLGNDDAGLLRHQRAADDRADPAGGRCFSALVPARLASKIAAPSIERSWRVPLHQVNGRDHGDASVHDQPDGGGRGVCGYLAEFFDAHREGSIGKFASDEGDGVPRLTTAPAENGTKPVAVQAEACRPRSG